MKGWSTVRIYIIEDDEMIRRALMRSLRSVDAEIRVFPEPIEAIGAARTERVDLVISDYSMPNLDGVQALGELRSVHQSVRTLLLSGNLPNEAVCGALKAGLVDRFLVKPWKQTELRAVIDELTQRVSQAVG